MIFDTHAHYDDSAFDTDRAELLSGFMMKNFTIINPGCDVKSSKAAIELAEKYEKVYAAVGIHPEELQENADRALEEIKVLAESPKCIAVGEIGLDYYWDKTKSEEQKRLFRMQLEFAVDRNLPVIIHDRDAHGDCLEIISEYPSLRGVFHCYSGSPEMAQVLLNNGWYLGFDGPITYKNAKKSLEVLRMCPRDRILIETDSPYLPPVPMRGTRNNSSNLEYVIEKISEITGMTREETEQRTYENACILFGI